MARYRMYRNGKLSCSTEMTVERGIKALDRVQTDWSRCIMSPDEVTAVYGTFDPNNARSVTRISARQLDVITTGGHELRFVVIE